MESQRRVLQNLNNVRKVKKINEISFRIFRYLKTFYGNDHYIEEITENTELPLVLLHLEASLYSSFPTILIDISNEKKQSKSFQNFLSEFKDILTMVIEYVNSKMISQSVIPPCCSLATVLCFMEETWPISCEVLTVIFNQYEVHRLFIFESVLKVMKIFETQNVISKNMKRITETIVLLIESVPVNVSRNMREITVDVGKILTKSYNDVQTISSCWIEIMLRHVDKKAKTENNINIFKHFFIHLVKFLDFPVLSTAAYILLTFSLRIFIKKINAEKSNASLKGLALELISFIGINFKKMINIAVKEENEKLINKVLQIYDENFRLDSKADDSETNLKIEYRMALIMIQFLEQKFASGAHSLSGSFFFMFYYHSVLECDSINIENGKKRKLSYSKSSDLSKFLYYLTETRKKKAPHLNEADARMLNKYLIFSGSDVQKVTDHCLEKIIFMAADKINSVRLSAVKHFVPVIEANTCLLSSNVFRIAIRSLLLDHSPLVRENILVVLSKIVLIHQPVSYNKILDENYERIFERLLDVNVRVRKATLNLLKNICFKNRSDKMVMKILSFVLTRIRDKDDSIISLTVEIFWLLWFEPSKNSHIEIWLRIKEIVNISNDNPSDFETLFLYILNSRNSTERMNIKKAILGKHENIMICLLNTFRNGFDLVVSDPILSNHLCCVNMYYIASKHLIQLAAEKKDFIIQFVENCLRDLSQYSGTKKYLLHRILNMMKLVSNLMPAGVKEMHLTNVKSSIEKQLPFLEIELFINVLPLYMFCLCITRDKKKIFQLFNTSWDMLKTFSKSPELNYNEAEKTIYILSTLITTFDSLAERLYEKIPAKEHLCEIIWRTDLAIITPTMLRALSLICMKFRYIWHKKEVQILYLNALQLDCHPNIKIQVIYNLHAFLKQEDDIIFRKGRENNVSFKHENLKNATGDSNVELIVIPRYLTMILELYLHPDMKLRQTICNFVVFLCQQTITNPCLLIPYLICMSSDIPPIKTVAENTLELVLEKYHSFVGCNLSNGVKLSFKFLNALFPDNVKGYTNYGNVYRSIHSVVYSKLRGEKKQAFIRNLLRKFDDKDIPLKELFFIAGSIAYLPYKNTEEILFVANKINVLASCDSLSSQLDEKCDHIDSTVQLGDEEASSFKTFELCLKKNIESLKKEWMDVWIRDAYKCILQLRLRQFFTAKCNEFIKKTKISTVLNSEDLTKFLKEIERNDKSYSHYFSLLANMYKQLHYRADET